MVVLVIVAVIHRHFSNTLTYHGGTSSRIMELLTTNQIHYVVATVVYNMQYPKIVIIFLLFFGI